VAAGFRPDDREPAPVILVATGSTAVAPNAPHFTTSGADNLFPVPTWFEGTRLAIFRSAAASLLDVDVVFAVPLQGVRR
jgi:hypothetical protein